MKTCFSGLIIFLICTVFAIPEAVVADEDFCKKIKWRDYNTQKKGYLEEIKKYYRDSQKEKFFESLKKLENLYREHAPCIDGGCGLSQLKNLDLARD